MLEFRKRGGRKNTRIIIDQQTDQLYQPLRTALRKSTLSHGFLSTDTRTAFQRTFSNKKMRILTPTEAEHIKNNIFIPVNKQLVATGNIQKVIGKNFTPVDVSERVGEPITPEEFKLKHHGRFSEVVYEIKEEDNPYQIYTSRSTFQNSNTLTKQLFTSAAVENKSQRNSVEDLPKPLFLSHSSKDLINKQMSVSLASPVQMNKQSTGAVSPRRYQFKQNLSSRGEEGECYRYNLFSAVDEACNSNCYKGCCSPNELVASRVARDWK